MPTDRVFTIEGSSVSNGNTENLTDSDNQSWVIKKIQVTAEGGTTLDASTATLSVQGDSFTDQNVVISALQAEYSELPPMDVEWPSNRDFEFDWTNDSGSSETINVMLWVEPMSGGP